LILRRDSNITATADGTGNGGNITINAPIMAGFENSDIIANAVRGRGGNIQITTQGIFGLQFRPQRTPNNDITASSQFGVSGIVQISTPSIDPDSGLVVLIADFADPTQQIAAGCAEDDGSSFIATGRGGIPVNPTQDVRSDRTWKDLRPLTTSAATVQPTPVLVEATKWDRDRNGKIQLIAELSPKVGTCQ
jgi:large exoprotein involved in heme utilization and adhesion